MATGSVSAQRFLARPRQTLAVRTDPALDAWPHTTRVLPWCLAGVLVMLWMVPFSNVAAPIALPVDATLDWPLVAGVVALWLATLGLAPSSWRPSLRISRVHVGIGCLFVAAVASVALNAEVLANLRRAVGGHKDGARARPVRAPVRGRRVGRPSQRGTGFRHPLARARDDHAPWPRSSNTALSRTPSTTGRRASSGRACSCRTTCT